MSMVDTSFGGAYDPSQAGMAPQAYDPSQSAMGGLLPVAPQAPAQSPFPPNLPPPPQQSSGGGGPLGLLGGLIQRYTTGYANDADAARTEMYNRRVAMQMMQAKMQALGRLRDGLPEAERAVFDADPIGYETALVKNREAMKLAGGESIGSVTGIATTAPLVGFDDKSGQGTSVAGNGALSVSNGAVGGDYTAGAGGIYSQRGGPPTFQGVSTFNAIPAGTSPSAFTPTIGGQGTPTTSTGGDSVPAPPAPPGAAPANAPRGIRNNNWGNLTQLAGGKQWAGQTGVDPGGYVQFATPQDGVNATIQNLKSYAAAHKLNTIQSIVSRWAPASEGNNTTAYANTVARSMGVNPNSTLNMADPNVLQGLAHGIFLAENGPKAVSAALTGASAPAGGPSASSTSPVPGLSVGQPVGAPYKIVTADQVPGGKPNWTYKIAPNGDMTPIPPDFTMADVQGNRGRFYSSEAFKSAQQSIAPLQGLDHVVSGVAPGGVMGMAALDTLNKSLNPGGVVRPQTVQLFLDHLGLPQEFNSHVLSTIGNGFLTTGIIKQIGQASWSYAKAHIDQANEVAQKDQQLAQQHGFKPEDVGESAPTMPPVPQWAQDAIPPPQARTVGKVYWGPTGPGKWTSKGWVRQ